jgi:hypothetical protein
MSSRMSKPHRGQEVNEYLNWEIYLNGFWLAIRQLSCVHLSELDLELMRYWIASYTMYLLRSKHGKICSNHKSFQQRPERRKMSAQITFGIAI